MKKILLISILSLYFFSNNLHAQSQFAQDDYKAYIEKFGKNIVDISTDKISDKKKMEKLVSLVDASIDAKWISRFVLGKHYKLFSSSQFDKFVNIYRDYMINSYAPKFLSYKGTMFSVNDVKFQKIFYNVSTEFYAVSNPKPISVSFRVKKRNDTIFIIDFIPEGISLLESQRSEFDSVISKKGPADFIENLSNKVKAMKIENEKIK